MIKIYVLILISLVPFLKYRNTLVILSLILIILRFFCSHYLDFFYFSYNFFWDPLSIPLIRLLVLITILIALSSLSNKKMLIFKKWFIFTILGLQFILTIAFRVKNFIIFYILFESSLVPTFILILGWGNQPERVQAGIYILIYTVFASLPLLVSILIWCKSIHSSSFFILVSSINNSLLYYLLAFFIRLAFLVKLPLYLIHLWLPKAHVEAPVSGSMILAGVLLKLGGYGIIRLSFKINTLFYSINHFILSWSLIGGVIAALICLFQRDIKFLIALSSVAHIAIVIARIITLSYWGINGAQFIIIGHGLCSSGLFCLANIVYERIKSRRIFLLKGLQTFIPSFAIGWFLLCTSNISAPPSLNLLGEINSISSLLSWSFICSFLLYILVFLAAAYSLFLYRQTQHGKLTFLVTPFGSPSLREWLLLASHWLPLNLLFTCPEVYQIFV